jgi:hypothetical protein
LGPLLAGRQHLPQRHYHAQHDDPQKRQTPLERLNMALKEDLALIRNYVSERDKELAELRAAAEKEVNDIQREIPKTLTPFEKELIRTAFKGGAAFGTAKLKEKQ